MTSGILLSFTAFHLMPLADVMAIGFTQPIVVDARLGRLASVSGSTGYGWIAVVLGLAGRSAGRHAVRLGLRSMDLGALAAAGGTICSAASMMLQRTLTRASIAVAHHGFVHDAVVARAAAEPGGLLGHARPAGSWPG